MTVSLGLLIIFCSPFYILEKKFSLQKIICGLLIAVNIFIFLFVNLNFIKQNNYLNFLANEYNYSSIINFDQKIKLLIKKIKEYDPQKTILVVENGFQYQSLNSKNPLPSTYKYFRHVEYYLPEYDLYELFYSDPRRYFYVKNYSRLKINYSDQIKIRPTVEKIIIISDNIDENFIKQSLIQKIKLNDQVTLFMINFNNQKEVKYYKYKFIKD